MGTVNDKNGKNDEVGLSTLNTLSAAQSFNKWMAGTIDPWCNGEILEIGGGIGNLSLYFLEKRKHLTITELKEEYCQVLRNRLKDYPSLRGILEMDIADLRFDEKFGHLFGKFDSVFALNVIEHIEERDQAGRNCRKLLKPWGTLVLLVPAFQDLYNRFDRELGHFLRFTQGHLSDLFEQNGFRVSHRQYFNAAGIAGWWFTGTILKRKMIPGGSMKVYNFLVPLFRILDYFTHKFVGLSVIQTGIKIPDA